jgi:hypothetical protein
MVSPWMLGFAHTGAMNVGIWVGAIVASVASLELWLVHFEPKLWFHPQL